MKLSFTNILNIILVVCLTGCGGRVTSWTVDHFYQGCESNKSVAQAQCYIKTVAIHDQFDLLDSFVVLWLSDTVRTTYSDLHAFMRCKNEAEYKALLRRQLAENEHFITFYVLSANDITLGETDSVWSTCLNIEGQVFVPQSIKTIDLLPEYKIIFGKKLNRFQRAYAVTFNAKDAEGQPLITKNTKYVKLELRSLRKKTMLTWAVDCNWCVPKLPCSLSDQFQGCSTCSN